MDKGGGLLQRPNSSQWPRRLCLIRLLLQAQRPPLCLALCFSHTSRPSVPWSHSAYFCLRAFARHSLFMEALPAFFTWPILVVLFRLHVVSSLSGRTIIPDMLYNTQFQAAPFTETTVCTTANGDPVLSLHYFHYSVLDLRCTSPSQQFAHL